MATAPPRPSKAALTQVYGPPSKWPAAARKAWGITTPIPASTPVSKPRGTPGASVTPGSVASPVKPFTPPGSTLVKVGTDNQLLNVAGIRSFLTSKGYHLPTSKDPNIGTALAAAMNSWGLHNIPRKFGSAAAVVTAMQSKGWHANGYSGTKNVDVFNSGAGAGDKTGKGAAANYTAGGVPKFTNQSVYDSTALDNATNSTGTVPISEGLANSGAQLVDANAMAQALAGQQFDPQIQALQDQQGKNKAQTKQDLHDIGSWYDQALASMHTAAGRDTAITKAGQDSITGADKAIIDSLGGSASAGASTVGEAAANGENTLAALGANQDQYNQDLAPIQALAKSGALASETAAGAGRSNSLAMQLAAMQSDKSGSMAAHLLDLTNQNNTTRDNRVTRLLQIKAQNAALAQQNVANQQADAGTRIAAIAAGARLAAAQARPAPGSFGATPVGTRNSMAQTIYNALATAKTPQQARAIVQAHVVQAGWNPSDPQVAGWANSVLSSGYQPQQ